MITKEQIPSVLGHTAYDQSHKKIGEVGQVYLDVETGEPEWITVRTGLFGMKETFVPVQPAEVRGEEVVLPFQHDQIKDAPKVETEDEGELPPEEEARLYEYYGMSYRPYSGMETGAPQQAPTTERTGQAQQTERAERTADDAMTRSEERLHVGKEQRESGRARLRKYVVTEEEQHTVPVRKEKVRVEREPITDENRDRAMAGEQIHESEHEVVLHEERPVAAKETVPVERVRMDKEAVTEEETVSGQVRKERIETEGTEGDQRKRR